MNQKKLNITLSILIALTIPILSQAQNITLENSKTRMVISLDGGIITEMRHQAIDVNPMHEYGHFLCFDRWGPSTQEDQDLGIPFHGNASKVGWTLQLDSTGNTGQRLVEMSCMLPIVRLKMDRKIVLGPYSSVFRVTEEISNVGDSAKVFNLVQHPTIGAPFLDKNTIVDTRVDSGFSQTANLPPSAEEILSWPDAVVDGDPTDLRYLTSDHSWNSAVVSFTLVPEEDHGWVTAVNPSLGLMVGYLWPTADYPWLNLWLRLNKSIPFARGLEFGSTGLHKTWPEVLEMDTLLGRKLYEELEVGASTVKSYHAFLAQVPADYKGVADVRLKGDSLVIDEYEMDQERRIALPFEGTQPVGISRSSSQIDSNARFWNFPNPFSAETRIVYHVLQKSHVRLDVYNAGGQLVRTLADGVQDAGEHQALFPAEDMPAGVYCCRLSSKGQHLQHKMILQKSH